MIDVAPSPRKRGEVTELVQMPIQLKPRFDGIEAGL
jgi:hypothetical protein